MGQKDADAAINKGAAATFDELVHYYSMKKRGDQRIKKHTFGSFKYARDSGEFEEYDILKDDYMRKYTYKLMQN
jgi:hypothetical protein